MYHAILVALNKKKTKSIRKERAKKKGRSKKIEIDVEMKSATIIMDGKGRIS